MSEVTLKEFLAELNHQLRMSSDLTITRWRLADFIADAYAKCQHEAEEERRLLTSHSDKGDVR